MATLLNAFTSIPSNEDENIEFLSWCSYFPLRRMTFVGRVGLISEEL
jgi:hypothetical protein